MTEPLLLASSTIGAMCFPNDDARILTFTRAHVGRVLLMLVSGEEGEDEARRARAFLGDDNNRWQLLKHGAEFDALRAEAQDAAADCAIAGQVLATILRFAAFPLLDRFASVNAAAGVVGEMIGRRRSYVMERWTKGRPVSHLWASYFGTEALIAPDVADPETARQLPIALVDWAFDEDAFEAFIGVATAFRRYGQNHQAVGSVARLLPAGADDALPFSVEELKIPDFVFAKPTARMIAAAGAD